MKNFKYVYLFVGLFVFCAIAIFHRECVVYVKYQLIWSARFVRVILPKWDENRAQRLSYVNDLARSDLGVRLAIRHLSYIERKSEGLNKLIVTSSEGVAGVDDELWRLAGDVSKAPAQRIAAYECLWLRTSQLKSVSGIFQLCKEEDRLTAGFSWQLLTSILRDSSIIGKLRVGISGKIETSSEEFNLLLNEYGNDIVGTREYLKSREGR